MDIDKINYNEVFKEVCSQVAPEVNALYEYFRESQNLKQESDVEKQLEILVSKRFISNSYIVDLSLITDYYARNMTEKYLSSLQGYKNRIRFFLES